jgi:hypothetical protein
MEALGFTVEVKVVNAEGREIYTAKVGRVEEAKIIIPPSDQPSLESVATVLMGAASS